jgi:hypothetical protein
VKIMPIIKPAIPSSIIGVRQFSVIAALQPEYNGPMKKPAPAPIPHIPNAEPVDLG